MAVNERVDSCDKLSLFGADCYDQSNCPQVASGTLAVAACFETPGCLG